MSVRNDESNTGIKVVTLKTFTGYNSFVDYSLGSSVCELFTNKEVPSGLWNPLPRIGERFIIRDHLDIEYNYLIIDDELFPKDKRLDMFSQEWLILDIKHEFSTDDTSEDDGDLIRTVVIVIGEGATILSDDYFG